MSRLTMEQLAALPLAIRKQVEEQLATKPSNRLGSKGKATCDRPQADRKLPHPFSQPDQAPALERAAKGKEESLGRATVRFVGFRVRPLDPDNFAASVKDLLDGLRHEGLIAGDEPWRLRLETEQVKVGSYKEEKTEIEIYLP